MIVPLHAAAVAAMLMGAPKVLQFMGHGFPMTAIEKTRICHMLVLEAHRNIDPRIAIPAGPADRTEPRMRVIEPGCQPTAIRPR